MATTNNSSNQQITQFNTLVGAANNNIANVSPGTAGQVLTSNGASAAPTYQAAGGGSDTAVTAYIVGPTKSDFTTVSAAITAAVAAGASSSSPAMIYLQMTTTIENLTIPSGIWVIGQSAQNPSNDGGTQTIPYQPQINGTVSFSAGANNCGLVNITVTPTGSNDAIDIGEVSVVSLTNVLTNTDAGIGLNVSTSFATVLAKDCFFNGTSHNLYIEGSSCFEYCYFDAAVLYNPAGSNIIFSDCTFSVGLTSNHTNGAENLFQRCSFGNGGNNIVLDLTNAGSPDLLIDCTINSTHTNQCTLTATAQVKNLGFSNYTTRNYATSPRSVPTTQGNLIPSRVVTGTTAMNALDYYLGVNSSSACTITLGCKLMDQVQIIKDQSGSASTNNITISPNTGTIDGASSKLISTNFGTMHFRFDGTNYWTIN